MGTTEIKNGKIDGDTLSWSLDITVPMPMTLTAEATVDGDALNGTGHRGCVRQLPDDGHARGLKSSLCERGARRASGAPLFVGRDQPRRLSGTMPPFSASFAITALCSAIFCSALPSAPAWTPSSWPSSLRAERLESRSSSFSRSTIDD